MDCGAPLGTGGVNLLGLKPDVCTADVGGEVLSKLNLRGGAELTELLDLGEVAEDGDRGDLGDVMPIPSPRFRFKFSFELDTVRRERDSNLRITGAGARVGVALALAIGVCGDDGTGHDDGVEGGAGGG
jgi:hypothetical protein